MTAVWMWFRVEWRTRWRALIGLLLLIAFATAAVASTTAGARRGTTAMDRLVAESDPATVMVLLNRGAYDWDVVRAMPQVESVAALATLPATEEGSKPLGSQEKEQILAGQHVGADDLSVFAVLDLPWARTLQTEHDPQELMKRPVVVEMNRIREARQLQPVTKKECVEEEVVEPTRIAHHIDDAAAIL